jgi:uncharacterized membrane protein SpoIIM required for sporulation
MSDGQLRSLRFRHEREATWQRLETLLTQVERNSASALSDEDLIAIPALYRAALSSLSVARETSLDQGLIDYLEALCTRAYFFVYGARSTLRERVVGFFSRDWPDAVRGLWRETLVSGLFMAIGAVAAFILVSRDPDWFYSLIPDMFNDGRNPAASTEELRKVIYDKADAHDALSFFATFLFTHNAQVSLMSFALGFAYCAPTLMLMTYNGLTVGAMLALYSSRGLGVELGGWLLIHGVTELFAITLAGAAGLKLGWSIAFPGKLSRLESAAQAGRQGGLVMAGVVIMLFVAGLLEGFARQLITQDIVRYSIAAASAVLWGLFYYARPSAPRRDHG